MRHPSISFFFFFFFYYIVVVVVDDLYTHCLCVYHLIGRKEEAGSIIQSAPTFYTATFESCQKGGRKKKTGPEPLRSKKTEKLSLGRGKWWTTIQVQAYFSDEHKQQHHDCHHHHQQQGMDGMVFIFSFRLIFDQHKKETTSPPSPRLTHTNTRKR